MIRASFKSVLLAGVSALCLVAGPAGAAEKAGVSAGVRGTVQLVSHATGRAVGRQVRSGEEIFLGDRVTSGPNAGLQIMLLDETTFTIGPNSEITIDEFVYDPATGAGKVAASVGKGVFRFITGKIGQADPSRMSIRTPVANMGIRGTMAGGYIYENPQGLLEAILFLVGEGEQNDGGYSRGAIEVSNGGKYVLISRPGWGTTIIGPNGQPTDPAQLPPELLNRLIRMLRPAGGGVFPGGTQRASVESGEDLADGDRNSDRNMAENFLRILGDRAGNLVTFEIGVTPIKDLTEIQTGIATYSQSGIGMSDGGSYDFLATANFANQTLNANFAFTSNTINGSDTFAFTSPFSAGAGGLASFTGSGSCSASLGGTCTGAVDLLNQGGDIAAAAAHKLEIVNGPSRAVGAGVAPRQ